MVDAPLARASNVIRPRIALSTIAGRGMDGARLDCRRKAIATAITSGRNRRSIRIE
jgi:hypothetical protein